MSELAGRRTDYERSDVSSRLVGWLAAGLGLFLIATPFVLLACYPDSIGSANVGYLRARPPAPILQIDPAADLRAFAHAEQERLTSYGWVDRQRKTVRIPIERAMELTAQRGLPGWRSP